MNGNAVKLSSGFALIAALLAAVYHSGRLPGAAQAAGAKGESTANAPFPRKASDYQGVELVLREAPQRIASQALVTDEFLFAIAPHNRMVAVSTVAHDPRYSHIAGALKDMNVAVISDPELVLRRKPDLLMVAHTARADYVDLVRAAGIPTFRILTLFGEFGQVAAGLEKTGYLTGEDAAARREIETLWVRINAAKKRRPADSRAARVLAYSSGAYSYGKGSLFDHIVRELGAINVSAEKGLGPYGQIGSEQVAAWNPDWIVAGADEGQLENARARLLADPGVAVTTAGRQAQVLVLKNLDYLSLSQHAVVLMEQLAAALYPEAK